MLHALADCRMAQTSTVHSGDLLLPYLGQIRTSPLSQRRHRRPDKRNRMFHPNLPDVGICRLKRNPSQTLLRGMKGLTNSIMKPVWRFSQVLSDPAHPSDVAPQSFRSMHRRSFWCFRLKSFMPSVSGVLATKHCGAISAHRQCSPRSNAGHCHPSRVPRRLE